MLVIYYERQSSNEACNQARIFLGWWPAGCGASDVSGGRWRCRGNAIGAETASTMAEAVTVMVVATAAALVVRRIGQSGGIRHGGGFTRPFVWDTRPFVWDT